MKRQQPEMMRQARRWDAVKLRYLDAGLCDGCAAQAAWGHQDNAGRWNDLHPPCDGCAPVVRDFSVPTRTRCGASSNVRRITCGTAPRP